MAGSLASRNEDLIGAPCDFLRAGNGLDGNNRGGRGHSFSHRHSRGHSNSPRASLSLGECFLWHFWFPGSIFKRRQTDSGADNGIHRCYNAFFASGIKSRFRDEAANWPFLRINWPSEFDNCPAGSDVIVVVSCPSYESVVSSLGRPGSREKGRKVETEGTYRSPVQEHLARQGRCNIESSGTDWLRGRPGFSLR